MQQLGKLLLHNDTRKVQTLARSGSSPSLVEDTPQSCSCYCSCECFLCPWRNLSHPTLLRRLPPYCPAPTPLTSQSYPPPAHSSFWFAPSPTSGLVRLQPLLVLKMR